MTQTWEGSPSEEPEVVAPAFPDEPTGQGEETGPDVPATWDTEKPDEPKE